MNHIAKGLAFLQLIPKEKFENLAAKWEIDKGVTKLCSKKLVNVLILSFVFERKSLREIASSYGVAKSTLDDALAKRPAGFFKDLCQVVLKELLHNIPHRKDRKIVRELLALDSSVCHVHGSMAEKYLEYKLEKKIGAIKFHAMWNVDNEWIEDFRITGYRNNDVTIGKKIKVPSGKILVFDRGYVDLKYWLMIVKSGSDFVTRLKKAPRQGHIYNYILNENNFEIDGILWDGEWTPSEATAYQNNLKPKQLKFRHVIYRDKVSKKIFNFITSNFELPAIEIANIYRKRWAVELLFRWMKGHLNIRRFGFKNKNAINIQLSVAVLVQLLIRLKMLLENYKGTSWEYLRNLRTCIDRFFFETCMEYGFEVINTLNPLRNKVLTDLQI